MLSNSLGSKAGMLGGLFAPMLFNPRSRFRIVVNAVPFEPFDCLIRIWATVKDEYLAGFGFFRWLNQIDWTWWAAVPLVAVDPFFGPPVDFFHCVGKERLFCVKDGSVFGTCHFLEESLVDVI